MDTVDPHLSKQRCFRDRRRGQGGANCTQQELEAYAVQMAAPGFEGSRASVKKLIGHLDEDDCYAVCSRCLQISREPATRKTPSRLLSRNRKLKRWAVSLRTTGRGANATQRQPLVSTALTSTQC
jgi:hypothetical protein